MQTNLASTKTQHMGNSDFASASVELTAADFARVFEMFPDLLCVVGFDGYFKRLNPAWTTVLGWTLEALAARPFLDLVHPDDRMATQAEVDKLIAGVTAILHEFRYRGQDGSYRWLQWNARRFAETQLIYVTAWDVTRQNWLEQENLEITDREKARLGRELHDGLCQNLAGIAALSATLSKTLAASSLSSLSNAAAEITELLKQAIDEARNLARGLGPVGLNEIGLDGALELMAPTVQHRFGVSCKFECDRPFPRLAPKVAAHLFRITQEAIHNAVTHGKAERIEIGLRREDGRAVLCVRDDGIGISGETCSRGGNGLHTMAYRAQLIGGLLQVRPHRRRGTEVTCSFALHARPESCERP